MDLVMLGEIKHHVNLKSVPQTQGKLEKQNFLFAGVEV